MTIKAKINVFKKVPLASAIAVALSAPVQATEFNFGEVAVQWDNTISYGVAWRTESPDSGQVMNENAQTLGFEGEGSSFNYDDGTLNFGKNEIYTNVVKYSTDLEVNYKNFGGFFRAKAFYDTELMDGEREWKPLTDETEDAAGKGYDLLDAFVWADYDFGDIPTTFRLGRQVVSWGESTFIQGGINSINPVDASAFRRPGAEVKEGLLPVNMFFTSIGITPDVSIEAFYQLEWEKTRPDPCGTFFSTVDFVSDGCGPVILGGASSELDILNQREDDIAQAVPLSVRLNPVTERLEDDEAKDDGQYGIAARWYAEELGDTEFGFYYMNIHSRLPYINGAVTNYTSDREQINPNATYDSYRPLYQIAYPEDNQLMGISFATSTEFGASISGEISYRPDAPIQWNAFEVLLAGNGAPYSRLYQQRLEEAGGTAAAEVSMYGEIAQGYDEFDIWQAQMTFIQFFDQALGADRIALAAEVGATYVPDLPDTDDARFGRSGAFGIGDNAGVFNSNLVDPDPAVNAAANAALNPVNWCSAETNPVSGDVNSGANVNTDYCNDDGYVTELSGGIRVRSSMSFNNAFVGVNVTPNLAVSYDIGNGPEPGAQFIDERLTTSLGVKFDYQNHTQVSVSYTQFDGGDYNVLKDRDNIALAASYSF